MTVLPTCDRERCSLQARREGAPHKAPLPMQDRERLPG